MKRLLSTDKMTHHNGKHRHFPWRDLLHYIQKRFSPLTIEMQHKRISEEVHHNQNVIILQRYPNWKMQVITWSGQLQGHALEAAEWLHHLQLLTTPSSIMYSHSCILTQNPYLLILHTPLSVPASIPPPPHTHTHATLEKSYCFMLHIFQCH